MEKMRFNTKIVLYNSYFDCDDRLNLKSILNIFQDVSSLHGELLGVGYKDMLTKNLYWVLSRVKFDILKAPVVNQTVIVETWPHIKGRIDFDRDIRILDESGEVLIIGTSKWCVIDCISRTLQRTDKVNYMGEYFLVENYNEKFNKIMLPLGDFEMKYTYNVMYSDLDHNKHMNNTNYANLVLSAINNKNISHFEINFIKECTVKDKIDIYTLKSDGEYLVGKVEGEERFRSYVK